MLCCPLPTDRKMRKNRVRVFFFFFFFFFLKCQIWVKNLLKFVFNGLKKHLHDLYMRFDCIPPKFSPFRNFKKNIGKLNSLTVRKKKKKKKKIPTDRPNFQILVGWGQHNNFFFFGLISKQVNSVLIIPICYLLLPIRLLSIVKFLSLLMKEHLECQLRTGRA